jgi:uncharacterized membrane protein YeaQ/YmgE (transglycosylase-associated protein family)
MELEQIVIFLVIGAVAGWLAGLILKKGFGIVGNIVVGVLGAVLGGWLFDVLNISVGGEWIGPIVTATAGALLLLLLISLVKKA